MRTFAQRRRRGQAMTEFALVVPTLITMLLFSMYFVELLHAKMKVQEAARFVAWEMTSFTLSDYGNNNAGRNDTAFNIAQQEVLADAQNRFQDLDSVDDRPAGNFVVGYSSFTATMANQQVRPSGRNIDTSGSSPGGPLVQGVLAAVNGTVDAMYNRFGFNTKGQIQVDVSATLDNRFLPKNFLNDRRGLFNQDVWGGSNLQSKVLRNRFTLVASGWHLPDGSDALMTINRNMGGPRAGVHNGGSPHGIYLQVKRMQALGVAQSLASIPGFSGLMNTLMFLGIPDPFTSAFAVAHNYGLAPGPGPTNDRWGCEYDRSHPGRDGMNNLETASKIDYRRRKCYDTLPFRDRQTYLDSPYIKSFLARGDYFMGCKNAQADDPSANDLGASVVQGDSNNRKIGCAQ